MMKIKEIFVKHKVEVHGSDMWVILFCDNLKAHVNDQVQNSFGDEKVLLYYQPRNMTEVVQPVDAKYKRPLRCNIDYGLAIWLISKENLIKWEVNMTAS